MTTDSPISKRQRIFIISGLLVVLVCLYLVGYLYRLSEWQRLEEEASVINPLLVKVMVAEPQSTPVELVLPSSTIAIRFTPIWARVNGYIEKFYVDIGDRVVEGQLLAEISTPELDRQLSQTEADLANANARLEIAKITMLRWNDIYSADSEAVSKQEVDEYNATYLAATAEVEAALANRQRLQQLVGFKKLYAPFTGVITERNIDLGTLISAGSDDTLQQIYKLEKIDVLRIWAPVPQTYYRSVKVGDIVDVRVREFPKLFKGVIARTSSALNPIARTLLTEIHIDNLEENLFTGAYAEVIFNFKPESPFYIIPTSAIIIREGHPHVAIVDEKGIVHMKRVEIGLDHGNTMEITNGVSEGDRIITNPNENIVEDVHVEIAKG